MPMNCQFGWFACPERTEENDTTHAARLAAKGIGYAQQLERAARCQRRNANSPDRKIDPALAGQSN